MRILLTANASYVPPRGGATRGNLAWMDHLARAGHECRIVCSSLGEGAGRDEQLRAEGIERPGGERAGGIEVARRGAIEVRSVAEPARRVQVLRELIGAFRPDWVLVSSEDLGHGLLREASHGAPGRVVYLAHTPQFFPFGPESWNPDPRGAAAVARAAGIVAVGHAMAGYIEQAIGRAPAIIHPPIYGEGPFPVHARFGEGLIAMINPCAVKGISIFLELAARFPALRFGALTGWGTTTADRRALEAAGNVEVLANCRDIDDVLARTRILLMPSLWFEGFGLIVMEAMLRGIPVIASDSGGLADAKQGTGYVIPAGGIERYEPEFDERAMPKPVVRETPVGPWTQALAELTTDRAAYEAESKSSREAALRFTSGLRAGRMEEYLLGLRGLGAQGAETSRMESLTPAQRSLLLERLRKREREGG
jgi:glycosyltransferase involved in cell wall biosynthesis